MRFSSTPSSVAPLARRLTLADALLAGLAPPVAFWLRDSGLAARAEPALVFYCCAGFLCGLACLSYFRVGQIDGRFLGLEDVRQCVKAAAATALATAALAFSLHGLAGVPRSAPALHALVFGAALLGLRAWAESRRRAFSGAMAQERAQGDGLASENVLLAGADEAAALYIRVCETLVGRRRRIVALLDDDSGRFGRCVRGRVIAGPLDSASRMIAEFGVHGVRIDKIVVASSDPAQAERMIARLLPVCREHGVVLERFGDAHAVGDVGRGESITASDRAAQNSLLAHEGGAETAAARIFAAAHARSAYWRRRRIFDILAAAAGLALLSPVLALVSLFVMLDVGGPVVFWQERVGRGGRRIRVHKFRTLGHPLSASGRLLSDEERLSPFGRFLRLTRLDEAPQLFDVLRGDLSLIGPRPLLPADLPPHAFIRLLAPPGLTGWAQVHGGKLVSAQEKGDLDAWYVRNASLLVDLRILLLTLRAPFRGDRRDEAVLRLARMNAALVAGADGQAPTRAAYAASSAASSGASSTASSEAVSAASSAASSATSNVASHAASSAARPSASPSAINAGALSADSVPEPHPA